MRTNPWDSLDPFRVRLELIQISLHDMDPDYLSTTSQDPVELYYHEGRYLVHDGRHRILRAWLAGELTIMAKLLT